MFALYLQAISVVTTKSTASGALGAEFSVKVCCHA